MAKLETGDRFVRTVTNPITWRDYHTAGYKSVVATVNQRGDVTDEEGRYHLFDRVKKIDPLACLVPRNDRPKARRNDPDTSKAAAKPVRDSLRVRAGLAICAGTPATGKELAAYLGAPLNSVTPRLAELRRAGIIKDSGQRHDGQILWVST